MPVFQKGASGNPAGNHKGSRHKSTLLAEKILEDDRDAIINAVVAAAKNGDPTAMRLCFERLVPLRKGRPVVFDLLPVKTAADIAGAVGELARAMAPSGAQPRTGYPSSPAIRLNGRPLLASSPTASRSNSSVERNRYSRVPCAFRDIRTERQG
jgi:hypothetical protein